VLLSALGCAPEARVQLLGFPTDVLNSVMSHAEQVRTRPAPKSSEASTAGFAFTLHVFNVQISSPVAGAAGGLLAGEACFRALLCVDGAAEAGAAQKT